MIKLHVGDQQYIIPALQFISGWISMFASMRNESWETGSMPMFAYPERGDDFPVVFFSVEMLCNIVSDAVNWRLREDTMFMSCNRSMLAFSETGTAKLSEAAIELWRSAALNIREKLFDDTDALVARCLFAHGQSQE